MNVYSASSANLLIDSYFTTYSHPIQFKVSLLVLNKQSLLQKEFGHFPTECFRPIHVFLFEKNKKIILILPILTCISCWKCFVFEKMNVKAIYFI